MVRTSVLCLPWARPLSQGVSPPHGPGMNKPSPLAVSRTRHFGHSLFLLFIFSFLDQNLPCPLGQRLSPSQTLMPLRVEARALSLFYRTRGAGRPGARGMEGGNMRPGSCLCPSVVTTQGLPQLSVKSNCRLPKKWSAVPSGGQ